MPDRTDRDRLLSYWRRSLRRDLAASWRWWLRPDTTGFSMASQFPSCANWLHREGELSEAALATIERAGLEAREWLRHWSVGGAADAIPSVARHHYRPLWRAAARACRRSGRAVAGA